MLFLLFDSECGFKNDRNTKITMKVLLKIKLKNTFANIN